MSILLASLAGGDFMNNSKWIPLIEYSNKYRVSISTLRRRIKTHSIDYKLDAGKYLLLDKDFIETEDDAQLATIRAESAAVLSETGEPVFATATKLLDELKKAYTFILQEKEEQVGQLRDEIADLRTLVNVLERENQMLLTNRSGAREINM